MHFLLQEMQQCNSVKVCIELALSDAYGEYEQTAAWLACIDEMFGRFDRIRLLGEEVALQGFDLENELTVVAICRILNRIAPAQAGVDGKEHLPRQTCGQLRKEPVLLVPGDRVGRSRRFGQHGDQRWHPLEPRATVAVAVSARARLRIVRATSRLRLMVVAVTPDATRSATRRSSVPSWIRRISRVPT